MIIYYEFLTPKIDSKENSRASPSSSFKRHKQKSETTNSPQKWLTMVSKLKKNWRKDFKKK